MAELAPPVRVSPFIRFCRWGALFTGIVWGSLRYKMLSRKEAQVREYEAQQKVIRDKQKAEQKKKLEREELLYLAKETGTPVPPGFEDKYK